MTTGCRTQYFLQNTTVF